MALNWMDVTQLSFNNLLLLDEVQLSWLPGWPEKEDLRSGWIDHIDPLFNRFC